MLTTFVLVTYESLWKWWKLVKITKICGDLENTSLVRRIVQIRKKITKMHGNKKKSLQLPSLKNSSRAVQAQLQSVNECPSTNNGSKNDKLMSTFSVMIKLSSTSSPLISFQLEWLFLLSNDLFCCIVETMRSNKFNQIEYQTVENNGNCPSNKSSWW